MSYVHVLLIVMDKNFLFINFIESLSESGKNMSRASVV